MIFDGSDNAVSQFSFHGGDGHESLFQSCHRLQGCHEGCGLPVNLRLAQLLLDEVFGQSGLAEGDAQVGECAQGESASGGELQDGLQLLRQFLVVQ